MNIRTSLSVASCVTLAAAAALALSTAAHAEEATKLGKPSVTFYYIPG